MHCGEERDVSEPREVGWRAPTSFSLPSSACQQNSGSQTPINPPSLNSVGPLQSSLACHMFLCAIYQSSRTIATWLLKNNEKNLNKEIQCILLKTHWEWNRYKYILYTAHNTQCSNKRWALYTRWAIEIKGELFLEKWEIHTSHCIDMNDNREEVYRDPQETDNSAAYKKGIAWLRSKVGKIQPLWSFTSLLKFELWECII